MKLIAGLGNFGARYAGNRHNIGFMLADRLHRHYHFAPWRSRLQAETAEGLIGPERVLLLKPQTYMNESGRAVQAAMAFYKIALSDVYAAHDELDLAPARMRVKKGGGNAGHNGLRSITAQCGNDYWRLRMGIGHPGVKELVHPYVLGDFAKSEEAWVDDLCRAMADEMELLMQGEDESFQSRVALQMQKSGHTDVKPIGAATKP